MDLSPSASIPDGATEARGPHETYSADFAVALITEKVRWLRDMSPLYELVKEGVDLKSIQWTAH